MPGAFYAGGVRLGGRHGIAVSHPMSFRSRFFSNRFDDDLINGQASVPSMLGLTVPLSLIT